MKIGYPCINNSIDCSSNQTFRLASYTPELFRKKVKNNLECIKKMLQFNKENGLLFLRIGSQLIPFATHKICKINWQKEFKKDFQEIGNYIKKHNIRISVHPDQFVLVNALSQKIFQNSLRELKYHAQVLDLMKINFSHKVQIHVGGAYGDKKGSMQRFIKRYNLLPKNIKNRLVIENDDKLYNIDDCLEISKKTKMPIVFDSLHHQLNNNGDNFKTALKKTIKTWKKKDGVQMVDYSQQEKTKRRGTHANNMDLKKFKLFIKQVRGLNFDAMFEIRDKEKSALMALKVLTQKF